MVGRWRSYSLWLPRAQCRCWPAEALGARRRKAEPPFDEPRGAAELENGRSDSRGEFGLCDPRRSQATTGASVRLTSVAQAHPYSPRQRAKREYERGPFSRLA